MLHSTARALVKRFGVVPLVLFSSACHGPSLPRFSANARALELSPLAAEAGAISDPAGVEPAVAPLAPDPLPAVPSAGPTSELLSCGLSNPMPGGFMAGYRADTGLDIAGMALPVFAIGDGVVDYAEPGHTLWTGPGDTDLAIRIRLDDPIAFGDRTITHVWYAHLSELAFEQAQDAKPRRRVKAGEYLGKNGKANGMWHLHLGLLLDGDTSQGWGTFLLEDDVRKVLCGMREKGRLPLMPKPAARS